MTVIVLSICMIRLICVNKRRNKLQEVQQCLSELQTELQKVFKIHQTVSTRWAMLKIGEENPQEIIQSVVTLVLGEYQARWSNMG